MATKVCPGSYIDYSNGCYYFGNHASYEMAKSTCEESGARLVDVNPVNTKFVKEKVKLLGGNDNWIGSYYIRSKLVKKKPGSCPIMKGQSRGSGAFAQINCNSANPYICQKYGKDVSGSNDLQFNAEFPPGFENEILVTEPNSQTTAAVAGKESSPTGMIAAFVSLGVLIVLAVLIRFICNRNKAHRLKTKMKEYRESEEKRMLRGNSASGVPRTSTINKPFDLPGNELGSSRSALRRIPSTPDTHSRRKQSFNDSELMRADRRRSIHRKESEYQRRRTQRSPSRERHHQTTRSYSPSPPYGNINGNVLRRSRSRGRSISRVESTTDVATTRFTDSSRSSSADSRKSDSAISMATTTTFRRSHKSRRSHSFRRRSSPSSIGYYVDRRRRSQGSRRLVSHHGPSQLQPRSMYEQYAVRKPPSPAMDVLSRRINKGHMRDRGFHHGRSLILGGGSLFFDTDLRNGRLPASKDSTYFPQMTNAWSREDLRTAAEFLSFENESKMLPGKNVPTRSILQCRQGPIRVNRHIHDFENPSHGQLQGKTPFQESEHIYESLDDKPVSSDTQEMTGGNQAVSLSDRTAARHQDSGLSRDLHRSSGRSRSSMRGRSLPAVPSS